jgi:hypothetical protein
MARQRNYRPPQMVVHQRFVNDLYTVAVPALVHLSGPHANFVSAESESFEKGFLGHYAEETGLTAWLPDILQNNVLDRDSTELILKNAALKYFGSTTETFSIPASSKNIISASASMQDASFSFRSHGEVTRYAGFYDRDVRAGDLVRLTTVVGGETKSFWTSVASLKPRYKEGVVEPFVENGHSNAESAASGSIVPIPDLTTGQNIAAISVSGTTWTDDLLARGTATVTYTVQVVIGGMGDTARFRVLASNNDTINGIALTQIGSDYTLPLGTLSGVSVEFTAPAAFTAGETYVFKATAAYSPVSLIAGGAFTVAASEKHSRETVYTLTVIKGGKISATTEASEHACPLLSVTTNTGIDRAPRVPVRKGDEPIPLGRYGVELRVSAGYLIEGDKFYVTANSAYSDIVPHLVISDNIPKDWVSAADLPVTVELFIAKDTVKVPRSILTDSGVVDSWAVEERTARIRPGLHVYESSWTLYGGQVALPVVARDRALTKAYLTFRYFVTDLAGSITLVRSAAELDQLISGPTDPSNPLKYAAFHALSGGQGSQVLLTAVADPTNLSEWEQVCDLISEREDVFHVFPLCYGDQQVTDLFYRHIKTMNQAEVAKERVLYLLDYTRNTMLLAQGTEDVPYEGSLSIEEDTSGLAYAAFTSETAEVDFLAWGVRRGDIIRTHFDYDLSGQITSADYTIAEIINSSTVRLTGNPGDYSIDPTRAVFEIWRNMTIAEQREVIADTAGIQDMLVRYILVDTADKALDVIGPAATLVGLIGSVVSHQGVSWYPLAGWTADGWQGKFSNADLNHMAGNGVLIITRHADGYIAARHAVTTAKSPPAGVAETSLDKKMSEEMFIRNAILVKKAFRSVLHGFVGITNVSAGTLKQIEANLYSAAKQLMRADAYPHLGGQITSDLQDLNIRPHDMFRDQAIVEFRVEGPFALNVLVCTLTI